MLIYKDSKSKLVDVPNFPATEIDADLDPTVVRVPLSAELEVSKLEQVVFDTAKLFKISAAAVEVHLFD